MICPSCRSDLKEEEKMGLPIHVCPACGGTWLEACKLERLLMSKDFNGQPAIPKPQFNRFEEEELYEHGPSPTHVKGEHHSRYREDSDRHLDWRESEHDHEHGHHDDHNLGHRRKRGFLGRLSSMFED